MSWRFGRGGAHAAALLDRLRCGNIPFLSMLSRAFTVRADGGTRIFDRFKLGYKLPLQIQLRRCTKSDADALALIGQATFLETFAGVLAGRDIVKHCASAHSIPLYESWLVEPAYQLWLAEVEPGSAPIGFMVVGSAQLPLPDSSNNDLELKRIYILSKFHGEVLGKRFIGEAVRHARERQAERLLLGVYAKKAGERVSADIQTRPRQLE